MHNIKHIDGKKTSNFFLNVLYFIKQKYKVKYSINIPKLKIPNTSIQILGRIFIKDTFRLLFVVLIKSFLNSFKK